MGKKFAGTYNNKCRDDQSEAAVHHVVSMGV